MRHRGRSRHRLFVCSSAARDPVPQMLPSAADRDDVTWVLSAALNFVIAVCYFAISGLIVRGLVRAGEWRTNRLGLATAGIFYTCAVHHGLHTFHMVEPALGFSSSSGLASR